MTRRVLLVTALAWLCGCAVGQHHSYLGVAPALGVRGEAPIALATHDQRAFVVSGDKEPDFVGLQRSGAGIPYGITTQSGRPLARDVNETVGGALERSGYAVTLVDAAPTESRDGVVARLRATGADRLLLLTLVRWKTDTYNNTTLSYELTLEVLDAAGDLLARTQVDGKEGLGGSMWNPPGHARKAVPEAYQRVIEELFRAPAVREAL